MSFDGKTFLETAKQLTIHKSEHCKRTAISRAYYSCYWRAREYCKANDLDSDEPRNHLAGSHQLLQDQLMGAGFYNVAGKLMNLHDRRIDADYGSEYPERLESTVPEIIRDAEELIALIDDLDGS